jgi:hypothetical protein
MALPALHPNTANSGLPSNLGKPEKTAVETAENYAALFLATNVKAQRRIRQMRVIVLRPRTY